MAIQSPLIFIAAAKFVPSMMSNVKQGISAVGGGDLPPDDVLQKIAYAEFGVAAITVLNIMPTLGSFLTALQFATPIMFLAPAFDVSQVSPYYAFILLLHLACAVIHLNNSISLPSIFRRGLMVAPVAYMGYMKLYGDWKGIERGVLAVSPDTTMPPADALAKMAYVELGGALLVTLGIFPSLFNKIVALNYATPIILLVMGGNGVEKIKNAPAYQQFLLCFHVAIAIALWADATYPTPKAEKKKGKQD